MIKILYIYDIENWALHNVGMYWAGLLKRTHVFIFAKLGMHCELYPADYDYVLFGCTLTTERFLRVKQILGGVHLLSRKWLPCYNKNFISVVHDPCELFKQESNWKATIPDLARLHHFSRLAVISNEMFEILANLGVACLKISTNSVLPARSPETIFPESLAVFSRAQAIPRKNINLFFEVKSESVSCVDRFDGYFNPKILPVAEYVKLIDMYNCYICTSWQEGGPLPLIDAIYRGCAVLTTPVGQTDEWVQHGINGFFCLTKRDFIARVKYLSRHDDVLLDFRLKSLGFAARKIEELIRSQLLSFLK